MEVAVTDRFWRNVQQGSPGECWGWLRSLDAYGYAQMARIVGGRHFSLKGHRVSWEIHFGPIDPRVKVTQTCGSRSCCNPEHLVTTTPELREERSRTRAMAQLQDRIDRGDPESCWPWRGKTRNGYGFVTMTERDGRQVRRYAHRLIYENEHAATLPSSVVVRHACDNKLCGNPAHLLTGSVADNVHDCVSRGRNVRGERAWNAVLTEQQAQQIRADHALGVSQASMAKQYGVSKGTIGDLVHGRTWRHVRHECK